MMLRWLFFLGLLLSIQSASGKPLILAVSHIDDNVCQDSPHYLVPLRDRIVSELVQKYDCVILNRANGLAMSTEKSIRDINSIDKGRKTDSFIPAADYAVCGYFHKGVYYSWAAYNAGLCKDEYVILINDLNDLTKYQKIEVKHGSPATASQAIVKAIAEKLELPPKTSSAESGSAGQNLTWMIMPVMRYENSKSLDDPRDIEASLKLELALQESPRVKRIVTHSEIAQIIQEHKMSVSGLSSEGAASEIAKIAGADIAVMPVISLADAGLLRLDVLLVDARYSALVNAETFEFKKEELDDVLKRAADKIAAFQPFSLNLKPATEEARELEAGLYLKRAANIYKNTINTDSILYQTLANIEAAWYLTGDDPYSVYKIKNALFSLGGQVRKNTSSAFREHLLAVAYSVLYNAMPTKKLPTPLINLAMFQVNLNANEEALKTLDLYNSKAKNQTLIDKHYALAAKAKALYKMGRYAEAAEAMNWDTERHVEWQNYLACDIYEKLGDEKKELHELSMLDYSETGKSWAAERYIFLLKKLEGPGAVLKVFNEEFHDWLKVKASIRLMAAQAYDEIGDKKSAAKLIYFASLSGGDQLFPDDSRTKSMEEVKLLNTKLADVKLEWKTLAQFHPVPEKFKFYIIPLGNLNESVLNKALDVSAVFLGTRPLVLPSIPMPEDIRAFKRERGQYNADVLLRRLVSAYRTMLPPDALAVIFVTDKDIYSGDLRFVYSQSWGCMQVVSSYHISGRPEDFASSLVNCFYDNLQRAALQKWRAVSCINLPCLNASNGSSSFKGRRRLLCEDCAAQIATTSYESMHQWLQANYFKYPEIDKDDLEDVRFNDEYTAKVRSVSSEAKGTSQR